MKIFMLILLCTLPIPSIASDMEAGFAPGDASNMVLRVILSAKKEILVATNSIPHKDIISSLLDAQRRGVVVKIVMDSSQTSVRDTSATFLADAVIPVRVDREHRIMHNQYLVVDGATVLTGSFNFTISAERHNAENVVVIWNNPTFAHNYATDWLRHWAHSSAYSNRH